MSEAVDIEKIEQDGSSVSIHTTSEELEDLKPRTVPDIIPKTEKTVLTDRQPSVSELIKLTERRSMSELSDKGKNYIVDNVKERATRFSDRNQSTPRQLKKLQSLENGSGSKVVDFDRTGSSINVFSHSDSDVSDDANNNLDNDNAIKATLKEGLRKSNPDLLAELERKDIEKLDASETFADNLVSRTPKNEDQIELKTINDKIRRHRNTISRKQVNQVIMKTQEESAGALQSLQVNQNLDKLTKSYSRRTSISRSITKALRASTSKEENDIKVEKKPQETAPITASQEILAKSEKKEEEKPEDHVANAKRIKWAAMERILDRVRSSDFVIKDRMKGLKTYPLCFRGRKYTID
jgi:hypothetical protein